MSGLRRYAPPDILIKDRNLMTEDSTINTKMPIYKRLQCALCLHIY
jgi:hypothetical protein